jgi:hypothetical protein
MPLSHLLPPPSSTLLRVAVALGIALTVVLLAPDRPPAAHASTLARPEDPVVMTGADLPWFVQTDTPPNLIVGFKYNGTSWIQIPVQADERRLRNYADIYNGLWGGTTYTNLVYTDIDTFVGGDPDPNFDIDDELVFMAKDAGQVAPAGSEPAVVVVPGSGVQVTVTDPVGGGTGYVYLFRSHGTIPPGAGASYVSYTFSLNSGAYLTTYNIPNGPNAENSVVTTPAYGWHFGDRWQSDALTITQPGASGVDILDRHKPMFAPGNCVRTEDTFNDGEGAFIANKSGPVRAIRSYVGANSGPLTQREHFFYAERQDIRTNLRVHIIGSVGDFYDYAPAASGMTYLNSLNPGGLTVDGVPEAAATGAITWEMLNGPQGAVFHSGSYETNISPFNYTSYYLDDATPSGSSGNPEFQCTGDTGPGTAYGFSGAWINQIVPNTDPALNATNYMTTTRTMYYRSPYATTVDALAAATSLQAQATTPLVATPAPWPGGAGDADFDGVADGADNCPTTANAGQQNNDRNFIDLPPSKPFDDLTAIDSDTLGDACDNDDDNDGIADNVEVPGPPCASASAATNATVADTDGDRRLDGAECLLGSDPANASSVPASSVAPDYDGDGVPDVYDPNDASAQSDGDGISDSQEFRLYGSNAARTNGDFDGCGDAREIASVDGNLTVNAADLGNVASAFGAATAPNYIVDFDIDKNGTVNAADLGLTAARFGACP